MKTEGEIIGLAMENVMKTQSRWSVIGEDKKTAAVVGLIMENIQTPPSPSTPSVLVCHSHKWARSDGGRMFFIYFY